MKKMKFVRYGGLSPVKQNQYTTDKDKTFHNPPRKKGLYAFPYLYTERFLLGATNYPGHVSNKVKWLKDENGNKIKYEDFFDGFDKKTHKDIIKKKYLILLKKLKIKTIDISHDYHHDDGETSYITVYKKPKTFEYSGEIWHHLGNHLKPHQIIEISGSWVKSDMEDYMIAFTLEKRSCKKEILKIAINKEEMKDYLLLPNPLKTHFGKDHLEVFIEKL